MIVWTFLRLYAEVPDAVDIPLTPLVLGRRRIAVFRKIISS